MAKPKPKLSDLEIVQRPLSELKTDPRNARKHGARNLDAIRDSLKRFGQRSPLVVRPNGTIIAGNGTFSQMKLLGMKAAACVVFTGTEQEAEALGLAMNRTAELAEWDTEALAKVAEGMPADLMEAAGFSEREITALLDSSFADDLGENLSDDRTDRKQSEDFPGDPAFKFALRLEETQHQLLMDAIGAYQKRVPSGTSTTALMHFCELYLDKIKAEVDSDVRGKKKARAK